MRQADLAAALVSVRRQESRVGTKEGVDQAICRRIAREVRSQCDAGYGPFAWPRLNEQAEDMWQRRPSVRSHAFQNGFSPRSDGPTETTKVARRLAGKQRSARLGDIGLKESLQQQRKKREGSGVSCGFLGQLGIEGEFGDRIAAKFDTGGEGGAPDHFRQLCGIRRQQVVAPATLGQMQQFRGV